MKHVDITMILDKSGSMGSIESQVVTSFNSFLSEQQAVDKPATLSLIQFDERYEVVYQGEDIQVAKPLNSDTYVPDGCTALLDAIGKTIVDTKKRVNSDTTKVIMVITTDGLENASTEYRLKQVRTMIKECEEEFGWTFIYLAADDASFDAHERMGFKHEYSIKTGRGGDAHVHASEMISKKLGLYRGTQLEKDLEFERQEREAAERLDEK